MARFTRHCAGSYTFREWTVGTSDLCYVETDPSYRWSAEHPDKGEHFFSRYRDAKAFVEAQEGV